MKTRDELWWGQKRRKMLKIMRMLGLRFILQENCACKSTSSPFESEEDFCNELIYQKKGLCLYHLSCQPLLDSRNDKISQLFGWAEDEEESRKQPQKHDPSTARRGRTPVFPWLSASTRVYVEANHYASALKNSQTKLNWPDDNNKLQ